MTYLPSSSSALSRTLAVAAVVAGLGLVASAFVPMAMAQTTTTTTTTTSATFSRDLTLGSTGADVTALQNWLISKGHTIAAGATGYFGAQTRAALAAWQAANGITPAAGYFGPITRAKVTPSGNVIITPKPPVKDDDSDNNSRDDLSVEVEIRNGRAYVETELDGTTGKFTLRTTSRSTIEREVAKRLNISTSEVRDVIEYDSTNSSSGSSNTTVTSRASTQSVDGADNDVATFEMRVQIRAIGDDMYIPRNGNDAFTYQIENASTGSTVSGATAQTAVISSDADTEGDRYRIDEGDIEEFIVTVTFNPLAADEGQSFRLQLLTINFSSSASGSTESSTLRSESKYQSESTFVAD